MFTGRITTLLSLLSATAQALRYQADQTPWNLNQNVAATRPVEYSGEWENHTFQPSPKNWRFPFYVLTLDRYVDGDPTNNDANGTVFEHNWMTDQFRFGGDARGLMNHLDYIQGMGIKGLYLAGSPFINMPWSGDGYGPLDFTLLDHHHGVLDDWRALVTEIHRRDMYVILDNTLATMGDLIAFEGFLNASTPFSWGEHDYLWKSDRHYHDFAPGNSENVSCQYPKFWGENGYPVGNDILDQENGCRDSEFDQYGDIKGVGAYPSWQSQLSKFASVQDRLRIWQQDVLDKLNVMSCMQISMLDIDGFRMDKGLQTPVDAQANFANYQRECARAHGKENFLIVGEVVGEIPLAAVYVGRGKQPDMKTENVTAAQLSNAQSSLTNSSAYLRDFGSSALDGAAFHYPTYGAMTRFLGLDGPIGFEGVDWVDHWSKLMQTDDMVNANTGEYDPKHMFGMTNQDVFRWPSLANGTQKQLLGLMITTLEMPGIPMILWGEEQGFYVLENLASDYVFGRTPMASQRAWQLHGCYRLGEEVYFEMPFNSSAYACHDDSVSLDHRDPSHPLRNVLKRMYQLREEYPTLNDGFTLRTLSSQTYNLFLPGSAGLPSPMGIWSAYRGRTEGVQDFTEAGLQGNQGVWLIYMNENKTVDYTFDCQNSSAALISAFPANTTVKNLFYPYEEYDLEASSVAYGIEGSTELNGCLPQLTMVPWEYKAFVPLENWREPIPTITRVLPGHDHRLQSSVAFGEQESVSLEIRFSSDMSCDSVTNSLVLHSTTQDGLSAALNSSSVSCRSEATDFPQYTGEVATAWIWTGTLVNVSNGVHTYTVNNASTEDGRLFTNAVDRFMFRIGQTDNPMIFPLSSNYTRNLLNKDETGNLYITPTAAGADMFRYSTNWGTSYSNWLEYTGNETTLTMQPWSGTDAQKWDGDHVILNYWSEMTGSSDHVQHIDLDDRLPRRWPHVFIEGSWNEYGYDSGLHNQMQQDSDMDGLWTFDLSADWPTQMILNVWGINPDGSPDKSAAFGDVNADHVLDWLPPDSLAANVINVTNPPPFPYTSFRLVANDGNYHYYVVPKGSAWVQLVVGLLIGLIPLFAGIVGIWLFVRAFYQVKFNEVGITEKGGILGILPTPAFLQRPNHETIRDAVINIFQRPDGDTADASALAVEAGSSDRRTVLIATLEYDIEDWQIKVKIGGLGVMAQLMGKSLTHQDLVWVIPCVGDIEYPTDQVGEPMTVTILGTDYSIGVQYHKLRNITYVLLDAPVFRKQTKAEPYPPRMDDLDSAIFYSAWNACIAEAIRRFPIDLYHINDYHGAAAPLHLLPETIPVCLSLHNAEFQGLWPLKSTKDMDEICRTYNLNEAVVKKYVQYGEVFNLLHAGANYLRIHQKGFGAVGVSKKYGKRSYARYPIFWGLAKIGALPNPDPSDVADWRKSIASPVSSRNAVEIDVVMESERGALRCQAQRWAGLEVKPDAELFVFVGRWSMQKGVDLIADVFFSVLEENPNAQLICIGPVIDLYGKFAALKLAKMMEKFPGRVYSKPEFTALPPYLFSGAEFALIPSRDEPFGLVAVEFGRKGALGVGARVGGLGQMPGWWYTIESTSTRHLLDQFKMAIKGALNSKKEVRALMRARSALQRFPVAQWVQDLDKLQSTSIKIHKKQANRTPGSTTTSSTPFFSSTAPSTAFNTPTGSRTPSRNHSRNPSANPSRSGSRDPSRTGSRNPSRNTSRNRNRRVLQTSSSEPDDAPEDMPSGRVFGPGHTSDGGLRRSRSFDTERRVARTPGQSRNASTSSLRRGHYEHTDMQPNSRPRGVSMVLEGDEDFIPIPGVTDQQDSREPDINEDPEDEGMSPLRYDEWYAKMAGSLPGGSMTPVHFNEPITRPSTPDSPTNNSSGDSVYSTDEVTALPQEPAKSNALLSLQSVRGEEEKGNFNLQNVDPFFTDATGMYYNTFENLLRSVDAKSSETTLSIEDFLVRSEKAWFSRYARAKLGKTPSSWSLATSTSNYGPTDRLIGGISVVRPVEATNGGEEFSLGNDYVKPRGFRSLLQQKIGDWPVYAFLLAFGQILAANSYQITLLTGANGQAANKLYVIASIYLAASIGWWVLFRCVKSVYVLSVPFFFYGMAFFLLGMGPYISSFGGRGWMDNVATGFYAVASASGSLFFALNFGSEGGTPVSSWVYRAGVIQGTQQIYVAVLWYWGDQLSRSTNHGVTTSSLITSSKVITAVTTPIAVLLWAIGLVIFLGLPNYYRQKPGVIPSFHGSLFHRKIVLWFFVMVILQNYWLSAPYGRNWAYLWSSQHAPTWAVAILLVVFFIGVWGGILYLLRVVSLQHSWTMCIFAIGLGAPRWCQMLWGVSGLGLYVPWGGQTCGALLGRSLWLWLGVLDAVQGVGFGMILLQTLTRQHIAFTLIAAQVVGSVATIVARATAPDATGPGTVFPDLALNIVHGLSQPWFWVALVCQLAICVGFMVFFRKEQLFKP